MSEAESSPEQQADVRLLLNGWIRRRLPQAVAECGTVDGAARILNIDGSTAQRWAREDPVLRAEIEQAKRRAGERVFGRIVGAALNASDEQILNHPTGPIMVVNSLLPEYRPNPAPAVAVQVSVTMADFAAALRTYRDSPMVGTDAAVVDGSVVSSVDGHNTRLQPCTDEAAPDAPDGRE